MTREEASEIVESAFDAWENEYSTGDDWSKEHEARDMAIKALEQKPCEDAISRQAVLDKILKFSVTDGRSVSVTGLWTEVNDLPPVTPQALEQEPCEDAVSRQWLMECVNEGWIKFDTEKDENRFIHLVRDIAPPVNSTKTGHWIPVSEELPDKEGYYLCSVRYMYPPYNFFEPEKVKYMDDVTIQKFDGEFNIEVKAWMSLPEPYKAERSGEE